MTERKIHLHTLAFDAESLTVTFMVDPGGLRAGGTVFLTQQMTLQRVNDYGIRIDKLERKVEALVLEALEEWETTEPVPLSDETTERDDDDDLGMGYDPDDH